MFLLPDEFANSLQRREQLIMAMVKEYSFFQMLSSLDNVGVSLI